MLKNRIATLALVGFMGLMGTELSAIMITTTSDVSVTTNGAGMAMATALNTVSVTDPEPIWHEQPISWKIAFGKNNCNEGSLQLLSFCCVTLEGNSRSEISTFNHVSCRYMAAKARSLGSVGGYGILPYLIHDAFSNCGTCVPVPGVGCM